MTAVVFLFYLFFTPKYNLRRDDPEIKIFGIKKFDYQNQFHHEKTRKLVYNIVGCPKIQKIHKLRGA